MPMPGGTSSHSLLCTSTSSHSSSTDEDADAAAAVHITATGMAVNVGLTAIKGGAGWLSGSTALIADAAHSLSDLSSDLVTIVAVRLARAPPDEDHPFGHGKFETIGALSVGALLLGGGLAIGWHAWTHALPAAWAATAGGAVAASADVATAADAATSGMEGQAGAMAVGAAVLSIGAKEWLYRRTVAVGEAVNSKTLIANAWHHRSDALSSFIALAGVGGTMSGVTWADPAAAAVVGALIVKAGTEIAWDSLRELADESSADAATMAVLHGVIAGLADVQGLGRVRCRAMGPYTIMDLRVSVAPKMSVSAAQQVARRVRRAVRAALPHVSEAMVYVDAAAHPGRRVRANPLQPPGVTRSTTPSSGVAATAHEAVPERSFGEIERVVERAVLRACPNVRAVSHMLVHWLPERGACAVELQIVVSDQLKVAAVHEIAAQARGIILRDVPEVVEADLHLELRDTS